MTDNIDKFAALDQPPPNFGESVPYGASTRFGASAAIATAPARVKVSEIRLDFCPRGGDERPFEEPVKKNKSVITASNRLEDFMGSATYQQAEGSEEQVGALRAAGFDVEQVLAQISPGYDAALDR